jgi:ssDNA-binding Zn-finger/Zn-ribbon topoisomerase 1
VNERARINCPECGAPMNRHAEKLDQSRGAGEKGWDTDLDGVLVEFHTCPVCKFVVERPSV